jgi:putative ABC transport system permease protein
MFSARSFPIVGTDPDYFNFRGLELEEGNWMGFVGECVIGSAVAEKLGLAVGDSLVSSPENFFDLAGVYPLKMNIVGVLQASDSPDDRAVFVDIKTNWVIMGLGHGHDDLSENYDPTVILERDSNVVKAGAKLYMYNTINAENIDSFHFHGDMSGYPLSSIIFIPDNQKSETLFRGRFAMGEFEEQVLVPEEVVDNLLQSIFRIRYIFNTVFILVGISTILILALIVALSVRLRKNEILTMFMIGSSRLKVAEILTFELILLTAGSGILAFIMYVCSGLFVNEFIQSFII